MIEKSLFPCHLAFPIAVLRQCGIGSKVELEVKDNCIIIRPVRTPRQGWTAAFKTMNKHGDDLLILPEEIDSETLEDWHE